MRALKFLLGAIVIAAIVAAGVVAVAVVAAIALIVLAIRWIRRAFGRTSPPSAPSSARRTAAAGNVIDVDATEVRASEPEPQTRSLER